jgi:hypothetical protein
MSRHSPLPAIVAALLLPFLLWGCNRGGELHLSGPTTPLMAPSPTGEECFPRTQAYWRRQCDTWQGEAPAHPDWAPRQIGELLAVTDSILQALGEDTCAALIADPPDDACQWALQQYAAALLNDESGFLGDGAPLAFEGSGNETVEEALDRIRALVEVGRCGAAAEQAVQINSGHACTAPLP